MNRRHAGSYLVITLTLAAAGCGAAGQNPIKAGPVDTGPQTLTAARNFLEGRWLLESFEVRPAGKPPVFLKGKGTLVYDEMGNMKMDIQADEASTDVLRASGID